MAIELTRTILDLAKAYDGYSLYFPAFIDFRGRIYRSGILHFHERDLSRSLLLLDCNNSTNNRYEVEDQYVHKLEARYLTATAFLHHSYSREEGCGEELINNLKKIIDANSNDDNIHECIAILAKKSKRPLQFYSNVLLYCHFRCNLISLTELCNAVPVTQDASASAYQLMAYFLLDEELAVKTNLFQTNGLIHDVYEYIKSHLIIYLKKELINENAPLCYILDRIITRSLVKKIFMPMIYGKTLNSTSKDLITSLSQDVLPKECVKLSTLCFKFWKDHFSGLESFIELIRLVGRICASLERPVLYSTPYFNTSQDYKKMESCSVRVFDTKERRRRSVTLTFPSNVRDKKKSRVSTAVNLIHQKDAQAAMYVAGGANKRGIPIYTVHDNFISNTIFCKFLTQLYRNAFKDMGPPLTLINQFLYMNLIEPELDNVDKQKYSYLCPGYYDKEIIPMNVIDDFLCTTPLSEAKNKAGWKKITDQLKMRYHLYCKSVCGPKKSFPEHSARWKRFHSKIEGEYCIHH